MHLHRLGERPDIPLELGALEVARLAFSSAWSELAYRRRIARKLDSLVSTEGVQLVESSDAFADSYFYRPTRHPHIPFIIRLHTPFAVGELFDRNIPEPVRWGVRAVERRLILRASHVTIPSEGGKHLFRREMRLGNLALRTLSNPPPLITPEPKASSAEAASEVLFVGRVTRFKGVEVLTEAIPKVLNRHPETHFTFVGADAPQTGEFTSTMAMLRAQLPEFARDKVIFAGHVQREELDAYYARATVCVFPSLFEVFGYTCLEAMLHSKAIVGSANGGMADLLDDGRCGLLYEPPNADDLSNKILKLLGNAELRRNLGNEARRRATTHFSAQQVMTETLTFYRQAIQDCR